MPKKEAEPAILEGTEERPSTRSAPARAADTLETPPGVNEQGERVAVTLADLKKEYGERRGAIVFEKIALLGGYGHPRDLPSDASLDLTGLKPKQKEELATILGE